MKFRIWNKLLQTFVASDEWFINGGGEVFFHDIMDHELTQAYSNNVVVQRFTEIYDTDNNPIYEGDIIHYFFDNEIDNIIIDVILICKYTLDNAWFSFVENIEDEYDGYYWLEIKNNCKVVGNIFDK